MGNSGVAAGDTANPSTVLSEWEKQGAEIDTKLYSADYCTVQIRCGSASDIQLHDAGTCLCIHQLDPELE